MNKRQTSPQNAHLQPPSLRQAFWYWLKLGCISFGGPAGQIAMMHRDLVEQKRWISDKRFLHALNYCMVLPGPEAQQLATYIGWLMHGTRGGLVASGLFVLPSMLLLMLLGFIYMAFGHVPALAAILAGIKPAVVALVLFAAYRMGKRILKHPVLWGIAALAFLAMLLKIAFPWVMLAAAVIGFVGQHVYPHIFNQKIGHAASKNAVVGAVIDDDTPTPPHAKFAISKALSILAGGVFAVLLLLGGLTAVFGWQSIYTQMGWFFSKAALLTFGGAYAVLPYVAQDAVQHYGWLSAQQMMDGLALGETTPGPLIMVVTFVGFVGGWLHSGVLQPWQTGVLAASIATFFTFLPSFIFIFAGAPLIESTKQNLKLNAPLTAITAAVVGVIVSLGVYLGMHVFVQVGVLDWLAIGSSALAFVLLARFNISVIKLIALFAGLGLLHLWV